MRLVVFVVLGVSVALLASACNHSASTSSDVEESTIPGFPGVKRIDQNSGCLSIPNSELDIYEVWCWGDFNKPEKLAFDNIGSFEAVSLGSNLESGCATLIVGDYGLVNDYEVWCWADFDNPKKLPIDFMRERISAGTGPQVFLRPGANLDSGCVDISHREFEVWCWDDFNNPKKLFPADNISNVEASPSFNSTCYGGTDGTDSELWCWGNSGTPKRFPIDLRSPRWSSASSLDSGCVGGKNIENEEFELWCWDDFDNLKKSPIELGLHSQLTLEANLKAGCIETPDEEIWCWGDFNNPKKMPLVTSADSFDHSFDFAPDAGCLIGGLPDSAEKDLWCWDDFENPRKSPIDVERGLFRISSNINLNSGCILGKLDGDVDSGLLCWEDFDNPKRLPIDEVIFLGFNFNYGLNLSGGCVEGRNNDRSGVWCWGDFDNPKEFPINPTRR